MGFPTLHKQHLSLHSLVSMSTMMSPTHNRIVPVVAAGGGSARSEIIPANPTSSYFSISHAIQARFRLIFDLLRDDAVADTLSKEGLRRFLHEVQRQEIELPGEKETYGFEEWMGFMWMYGGFDPIRELDERKKDLGRPITNYFISSSHNTYLSGNQLSSKSSTEAYKNVLIRGCRCIEIDVHNGEPKGPYKPYITSTAPSQLAVTAKEAKEKYTREMKSKFEHYKEKLKVGSHGHHRNVPSISRDHSSDPDDDSESAIDLSEDAPEKPISKSSSRNSSSSAVGLKSEPRVLHAWTLTRYVGFRDVCRTIMETAFLTTQLPLIVSLEVGCDLEQQEVMVQIMKEEWKGHLVDEAHPLCDPSIRLPNLDELKEKILVKVKKATEQPVGGNLKPTDTILSTSSSSLSPALSHDPESGYSGSEDERSSKPRLKKKTKICESLSQLGIYTHSEHFASFSQPEARSPPHVFSINERDILDLHSADSEAMMGHNRDYFMRAYPAGRRIDSSNPDPSVFWRKGVQMVALNWQNWDEGTMLNDAMFADEAGWVLKPQAYLPEGSGRDVEGMRKVMDLKVTVYAAQHVPLPKDAKVEGFRPFVKLELHVDKPEGPPQEGGGRTKEGRWKLRTKYSKGVSPDWEGEVCGFVGVTGVVEELSFLRLKIEDDGYTSDTLAAWACIRLDRLQSGYRFVKLFDAKGKQTDGMIVVGVEKTVR